MDGALAERAFEVSSRTGYVWCGAWRNRWVLHGPLVTTNNSRVHLSDKELRKHSLDYLASLPFDGFAIGGSLGKVSVG